MRGKYRVFSKPMPTHRVDLENAVEAVINGLKENPGEVLAIISKHVDFTEREKQNFIVELNKL